MVGRLTVSNLTPILIGLGIIKTGNQLIMEQYRLHNMVNMS